MSVGEQHDPADVGARFRSGADWFIAEDRKGVNTYCIGANSERAVDLVHVLAMQFPHEVRVSITSLRDEKTWKGRCSRADIRDVLARLKLLLAGYGGVEIAIYDSVDQLTLTPELLVVVYSRSGRWHKKLLSMGLEQRKVPPTAVWCAPRNALSHAPELIDSLAQAVRRLNLIETEPDEPEG